MTLYTESTISLLRLYTHSSSSAGAEFCAASRATIGRTRDGGETDNSHPPIHPIKLCQPGDFSDPNDRAVYELVTRCFLAAFSDDARGQRTAIRAAVGPEIFNASGTMVNERNYLDVYRYDKWSGNTIPVFLPDRNYKIHEFVLRDGRTVPPKRIHESELIKKMDDEGIGTDATAASHIETIQKRGYVLKDNDGYFSPTELGLALADGYQAMGRGNLVSRRESFQSSFPRPFLLHWRVGPDPPFSPNQ